MKQCCRFSLTQILMILAVMLFAGCQFLPNQENTSTADSLKQSETGTLEDSAIFNEAKIDAMLAKPHQDEYFFIKVKKNVNRSQLATVADIGVQVVRDFKTIPWKLVKVPTGAKLKSAMMAFSNDSAIEAVHPDYVIRAIDSPKVHLTPNDPSFTDLWGLNNTGQTGGTAGADINAPEAWNITTGDPSVIIADIDTGVDYTHPDLAANMWTNPGEIAGNGIDDDGNGYVDDVYGYDFVNDDGDPMDDQGHGTHTSGTIAAVGNDGVGVVGVAWNAKIMAVKFLDSSGNGVLSDAISAIEYSTLMGAKISNNSWGCLECGSDGDAMYDAIAAFGAAGGLFLAAAGNEGSDNDVSGYYPSGYSLSNIIAVAASDHNDQKADFSCWGLTSVDVAAPGVNILSTLPGDSYAPWNGTSMATPQVAGLAALIKSQFPSYTNLQIKDAILSTVRPVPAFAGFIATGGVVDAYAALTGGTTASDDILVDTGHGNFSVVSQSVLDSWVFHMTGNGHSVTFGDELSTLDQYNTLILFLPNVVYTPAEKESIDSFISAGGRLVLVGEWGGFMDTYGIGAVLNDVGAPYGITFNNNVISDAVSNDGHPDWVVTSSIADDSPYTVDVDTIVEYAASSLSLSVGAVALVTGSENATVSALILNQQSDAEALSPDQVSENLTRADLILPFSLKSNAQNKNPQGLNFVAGQVSDEPYIVSSNPQIGVVTLPPSGATVINFDGLDAPCLFSSTSPLREQYEGLGVHFSGEGSSTGGSVLNECGNFSVSGHSPPNFLAFNNACCTSTPQVITFDTAINHFQINQGSGSHDVTLEVVAYNATGGIVGTTSGITEPGLSTLTVSGEGITKVVISDNGSSADWVIDDMAFVTSGSGPPAEAPVMVGHNQIGIQGGDVVAFGDISLFKGDDPDGDGEASLMEYDNETLLLNLVAVDVPVIGVNPTSFSIFLAPGAAPAQYPLTISNLGEAVLSFEIDVLSALMSVVGDESKVPAFQGYKSKGINSQNNETEEDTTPNPLRPGISISSPASSNVLVYDNNSNWQRAMTALTNLGIPFTRSTLGDFVSLLTGGTAWDLVVMDDPSSHPDGSWTTELAAYIAGGGKVIIGTWDLQTYSDLQDAMQVTVATSIGSPQTVYKWSEHAVFSTPNEISSVLPSSSSWTDNGDELASVSTANQIGGYTASETDNRAAIIVGNDNRTICNGFLFDDFGGDDDSDGKEDMVELLENEVMFLLEGGGSPTMVEDFEQGTGWPWTPWNSIGITSAASAAAMQVNSSVSPDGTPGEVGAAYAHDGSYGILDPNPEAGSSVEGWYYRTDGTVGHPGDTLSMWVHTGTGRAYLGFGATAAGSFSLVAASNSGELVIQQNASYGFSNVAASTFSWSGDKWYKLEVQFLSDSVVHGILYDSDGVTVLTAVDADLSSLGFSPGGVAMRAFGDFWLDTIAVSGGSSSSPTWLSATPLIGTVLPDASEEITVGVDVAGLDAGVYNGSLTISSNDPAAPEMIVPVTLTVAVVDLEAPVLERVVDYHRVASVVWSDTVNNPMHVEGYRLYFSSTPGVDLDDAYVEVYGNLTHGYLMFELDQTQYIKVAAFSGSVIGSLSAEEMEMRTMSFTDLVRPPAVTGLSANNTATGELSVAWTPTSHRFENGFIVRLGLSGATATYGTVTTGSSVSFSDLPAGSYNYSVLPYRTTGGTVSERDFFGFVNEGTITVE